jgi:hypothetical protein
MFIWFGCGVKMIGKENYPLKCPTCGAKLQ